MWINIFIVIVAVFYSILAHSDDKVLNVFSRELVDNDSYISLSNKERAWLDGRKFLRLAVPQPDSPPMDITIRSNSYEGVTADIIGLVSHALKIEVKVYIYPSREKAIEAVVNGEADFIGTSNSYEESKGLGLTQPYIFDEPALYKGFSVPSQKIKNVAIPEYYLPFFESVHLLPGMEWKVYPSRYAAISAVAYGRVDAVLVDMLSGNFLVNKFYQDSVQLMRPVYAHTRGFAFGVAEKEIILKDVLNKAISSISEVSKNSVVKRWSGGGFSIQSILPDLDDEDWAYLSKRRVINVAVNSELPPLSFIDNKGDLHGISSDVLQVLGSKLGISFEIIPVDSAKQQIAYIDNGKADITILNETAARSMKYSFTRKFALDPLAYVIRKDMKEHSLENILKKGRLAIIDNFMATLKEKKEFQASSYEMFHNVSEAVDCVGLGKCDAVILPLRVAKYFVNFNYPDQLVIGGELFESMPLGAGFMARQADRQLIRILDKVIAMIPPDELEELGNRWRVSAKYDVITWQSAMREFGILISVTLGLLLLGLSWVFSLRKQIKHRNDAEAALEAQLKFIEELVDSTPHPIYARDSSGTLILCNGSYAEFIGAEKNELLGSSISDAERRWPHFSILGEIFRRTVEDGIVRSGDYRIQLAERDVDIYHWLQVYRDLSGEVQGVVGGWIDVSERAALVRELAEASQSAQEASRAKSTFLATMSHEIRTPMNAIIGLLELTLRKGSLSVEASESISVVYQSANDLLALIGDILDISKIESGKLELAPSPHQIIELSRSVINVFTVTARQKGLTLSLTATDDVTVMVDPVRYKQILSNLVSNAIKFTRKGGVNVHLMLERVGESCEVKINVTDSGIGISKQDLKLLFQPFSQVGQPADMHKSGTGLGLMISRTLCQMMCGDLEVSSEPGQGTTVSLYLILPLAESATTLSEPSEPEPLSLPETIGRQILIIDDHPTNRLLVGQQLAFLGHEVQAVASAQEALHSLGARCFDIIITDFNMPEMDGLELTRCYRQQEHDEGRKRAIIIGLTADARQEQIQKAIEAGMDDCLFKPVSLDELRDCISAHTKGYVDTQPSDIASSINQRLGPLTSGRADLMGPLLMEFLKAADDDLVALEKASLAGDNQAFLANLHRLKGGARIIGADVLVACCIAWEQSVRLPMCMPSALRQVQHSYEQLKAGVHYWEENGMKGS
ncbi:TPA: transporter substrate-binding domain-containing protein [Aeromonas veronii]|nr:transporter substrate-binding domain-containing protein [Aeromonas veronii]